MEKESQRWDFRKFKVLQGPSRTFKLEIEFILEGIHLL